MGGSSGKDTKDSYRKPEANLREYSDNQGLPGIYSPQEN